MKSSRKEGLSILPSLLRSMDYDSWARTGFTVLEMAGRSKTEQVTDLEFEIRIEAPNY